jgi:hypothetical protein
LIRQETHGTNPTVVQTIQTGRRNVNSRMFIKILSFGLVLVTYDAHFRWFRFIIILLNPINQPIIKYNNNNNNNKK